MRKVSRAMEDISKKVGTAIFDYNMLQDGDKVMVGVSGGKDSLTLLKMLTYRQTFAPIEFDIMAVHIDMGMPGMNIDELREYFQKEEINFRIDKINILEDKEWEDIGCFWCAWNRRKTMFNMGKEIGFNKIAFGHHFDDIVETTLINMFYQGNISTMTPCQEMFDGKMHIIRPLAYVEEQEIVQFAKEANYPQVVEEKCVHDDNSKRAYIKELLARLSQDNPAIKTNIFKSLQRIKEDYLL